MIETARGVYPLYGLYGDVPLDRVWFLTSLSQTGNIILGDSVLNRVYFAGVYPNYKPGFACTIDLIC